MEPVTLPPPRTGLFSRTQKTTASPIPLKGIRQNRIQLPQERIRAFDTTNTLHKILRQVFYINSYFLFDQLLMNSV